MGHATNQALRPRNARMGRAQDPEGPGAPAARFDMSAMSHEVRLDDAVASVRAAMVELDKALIELQRHPQLAEQLDQNDRELAAVISRYRAQLDELIP